ncbi:MAG: hypothetical protein Kow0059_10900 [Candidatus Sumerlaeia bacterium]
MKQIHTTRAGQLKQRGWITDALSKRRAALNIKPKYGFLGQSRHRRPDSTAGPDDFTGAVIPKKG